MHVPVLLQSTIELLDPREGERVVDATLGLAGHSQKIAKLLGKKGILIGFDADADLLLKAKQNLEKIDCQKIFFHSNFRHLQTLLDEKLIDEVDDVLFDLGLNSEQYEISGRGFSFQKDEPLLMTLATEITDSTLTAKEIVNTWAEESLADIIYGYGEERLSRKIAKAIVEARAEKPIETTKDLVTVIEKVMPASRRHGKIHFATKTFQALRITVNDELGALREGLAGAWIKLAIGGRLAVISFHSLEARIVKDFYKEKLKLGEGQLLTKRAVKPSREEEIENPRSRSAQLRVIKKII